MKKEKFWVYLDLNVYSRPFDDQTQEKIYKETEAIAVIWDYVKIGVIQLVSSDILIFEVNNILSESKSSKVIAYIKLRSKHVEQSEQIKKMAEAIHDNCKIKPRDALHLGSAVESEVDYFLTCDTRVSKKSTNRCVKRIAKKFCKPYVSVMNPTQFVKKYFS